MIEVWKVLALIILGMSIGVGNACISAPEKTELEGVLDKLRK